ncbi:MULTISPECIES: GNAT family N-acetyltransferase [unclassified Streptomyces]|uniref:GNAT family N-acetyltransferase n=1 Tax=unclassified Streptomyces TaxID=2593676 RepID=UPI00109E8B48|nr:GNAT family N-acetyltransferase [Streptomyces sp. A1136]THA55673.1 GNAT family N-acetyltransferase [Streptomyces sp. A1136]
MTRHVIRPVRRDEWEKAKELRLTALRDPAAAVAFLETEEQAEAQPDQFWQGRTERAAEGRGARQFIAEAAEGQWDGSVTLLVEGAGVPDYFGEMVEQEQGHLVGVFVRAEQRGTGLTEALFEAALEWAWSLEGPELERVRLFVHEENARAEAFYRRFGFRESGVTVPMPGDAGGAKEREYVFPRPGRG